MAWGADEVNLLQARNVHEARLGADRRVLLDEIVVVGPGGAHATPVLELRAQSAVAVT